MELMGVQFDIAWEQKAANFEKVRRLLREAAPERNSLVVLPEMFATGFSMNTNVIAESSGADTEQFLSSLAAELGIYLVGGAAIRGKDNKVRNKALVFGPDGKFLAYYAKMRPFAPGGELEHYTPGKQPIAFNWLESRVSPFVCYDLRFPEIFRQAAAEHRPEVFIVIASWPEKRIQHWVLLLKARAIENQAYVIGVNRIGKDPYYNYGGRSLIVDPHGEVVADAEGREGVIRGAYELPNLKKYREGLPFLNDLKSQ